MRISDWSSDVCSSDLAALSALAGLALAFYFFGKVKQADPGNARMVQLMTAIQEGSRAFLRREYTWVAGFVVIMTVLIAVFLDYGRPWGAIAYISGAVLSALAGFVGMTVGTLANARPPPPAPTGRSEGRRGGKKGGRS